MKVLNFKCKCGCTRIEEVMVGVVTAMQVTDICPEGDADYGEQTYCDGGSVDRYQCVECGAVIKDPCDNSIPKAPSELYWALREQGMVNASHRYTVKAHFHAEDGTHIGEATYHYDLLGDMEDDAELLAQTDSKDSIYDDPRIHGVSTKFEVVSVDELPHE
jgi:hypothetical protein